MYRLQIISEAQRELDEEIAYSIKHWGRDHGKRYSQELKKQILDLKRNPHLYPVRNEIFTHSDKGIQRQPDCFIVQESRKVIIVLAVLSIHRNVNPEMLKRRLTT